MMDIDEQTVSRDKALEYGGKLAVHRRWAWMFGVVIHVYFFIVAVFVHQIPFLRLADLLIPILVWMVVGAVEGIILETLVYRRLSSQPEFYGDQIRALGSFRGPFDMKGCWKYWQTFKFRHLAGEITTVVATGIALYLLAHLYFALAVLTGYSLSVDLFWLKRRDQFSDN